MSSHSTGAANTNSTFGERVHVSRQPSMSSQNSSEERIGARKVVRTDSLNSIDLHHHIRPLARVSSTSSIESNSLGRRRREANRLEEPQYTMSRGSRSESNLVAPVESAREPEEFSDTETLDGRRVRAKYASTTGERRNTSWGTALSDHNSFGDLAWRNNTVGARDSSVNVGVPNLSGDSSKRNSQPPRDLSQEARMRHSHDTMEFTGTSSNGEGTSASNRNSSRPVPPRKNSDWEPARNRGGSSVSNRMPASTGPNLNQGTSVQSYGNPSTPHMAFRETGGLSPSPGRIRAQTRSSDLYEDLSSGRDTRGLPPPAQGRQPPAEVILPRWQPDAEVTFCPICRTQFSKYFFIVVRPMRTNTISQVSLLENIIAGMFCLFSDVFGSAKSQNELVLTLWK